ncbi:MAG: hypothetical protein IKU84_06155 [Clostridia bacterium]|nr:hypothetical protein [Clostridia bacterium]
MNIGQTLHHTKYYDGYEGCGEIELTARGTSLPVLHIWEGYFSEIFDNPPLDGQGWCGFTRDYNQCEGTFNNHEPQRISNLQEYIDDMSRRKEDCWELSETEAVYNLILKWLISAKKSGSEEVLIKLD